MAISLNFEDRFSYPDPNGPAPGISKDVAQSLTSEELLQISPDLTEMVSIVRGYSVLLQRTSPLEIFNIITTDSDPRIALILSAARSKTNNEPLFGGLGQIKELMFADPAIPGASNYTNRTLFTDGIRRVSAALTAARIIGQLSQITEQASHADRIEDKALEELDRIINTWDINSGGDSGSAKKDEEEDIPGAFYFEPKTFTVPAEKTLVVEWQSPSMNSSWDVVGTYSGSVDSWLIVNDLAEAINGQSLSNPDNVLLAAPELSGPYFVNRVNLTPTQYHCLKFYPRRPLPGVLAYSINIRVNVVLNEGASDSSTTAFPVNQAPFIWGTQGDSLNNYIVNGSIILIRYNKLQGIRAAAEGYNPFVLYFRNAFTYDETSTPPPSESKLVYRVQPWMNAEMQTTIDDLESDMTQTIEVKIPRLVSDDPAKQLELDNNRFSQVSLAMSTALTEIEIDSFLASAIIRNDPITMPSPMSALELVPWSRQRIISAIVLDILEVPSDIELATGDRSRPLSSFSSKPRSGMVSNPWSNTSSSILLKKEKTYVSPRRPSKKWSTIKEEANNILKGGTPW